MANWKAKIKSDLVGFWTFPGGTTPESQTSIEDMADEISKSVSNSAHTELMTEWELLLTKHDLMLSAHITTLNAMIGLMSALALEPTLTSSKAAASAVGGTLDSIISEIGVLKGEITSLKSKIESYKG